MNNFHTFWKIFKGFVIAFLVLILAITIPVKLREHNYWQVLLIIVMAAYQFTILFALSFYFNSMAVNFTADAEYMYLTYGDGKEIVFLHSCVKKIEQTPNKFIFYLSNGEKYYLSNIHSISGSRKKRLLELKKIYPGFL